MAAKDHHHTSRKSSHTSSATSRLLVSLICLASLFLCLSLFRSDVASTSSNHVDVIGNANVDCNYSNGRWIYDRTIRSPPRYDHTCKEIFSGWNCAANNKSNAVDVIRWRWKPYGCDLPQFDAVKFLESFRDTNIGFVGDSLNRNMFVSLSCALKRVSADVKKWRPVGADRGFTFVKYNLTMAYHRTNLLVRYGRWSASNREGDLEAIGYKEGYRVDVDVPEGTWKDAPRFHDVLVFNTGHWWWAPSKFDPVKSPMLFFENGAPIIPPISPDAGLDKALPHMVSFIERNSKPDAILFFRTQSPRHFEGGDWDRGGTCPRLQPLMPQEVEEFFAVEKNGTNVETRLVNQHLYEALERKSSFRVLEVTSLSEFRADAHPSSTGGKKHDDCMHWCLPGLTDTWNDLLVAQLNSIRSRL